MKVKIEESWRRRLQEEFDKPYFERLVAFVHEEYGYYRKQSDIMYVMVILMAIIVLVFQELGMRISKHTDRRL